MKRPQPAPITGASGESASRSERFARRMLDLGKLAVGEIARERDPFGELGLACVASEHAGKPARALRWALSALVGGRVGVCIVGKIACEPPDIGHGGEALRRDLLHPAPKRRGVRHRHHRRAHHAGIEQLAFGQPLGVGGAAGGNFSGFDRDEVGGRGAGIDEQCVGMAPGNQAQRSHANWPRRPRACGVWRPPDARKPASPA